MYEKGIYKSIKKLLTLVFGKKVIMAEFGFIKVAAAVPSVRVADCIYNSERIMGLIERADSQGVEFIVFPELALTAYSCKDLFHQKQLLESAEEALAQLVGETAEMDITVILGMPVRRGTQIAFWPIAVKREKADGLLLHGSLTMIP